MSHTPMMRQYLEVRAKLASDTILFFRLGDFYEMFFEDAEIGSRLLGLTLTQRNGTPMAGVPFHAANSYIEKLLKAGKKVAICDQIEAAGLGKKLVERGITRILSQGTVLEDSQIEARENSYIVAIQNTPAALCAAWLDLSSGEFQLTFETNKEDLVDLLIALDPKEIVYPDDSDAEDKYIFQKLCSSKPVTELAASIFSNKNSSSILLKTLNVSSLDAFGIASNCPAIGCAGALIHYACENLCQLPQNISKLSFFDCTKGLKLDSATLKNLEIFQSIRGSRDGSLLSLLDNCVTAAGSRCVQKFLTKPPLDLIEIKRRQSILSDFINCPIYVKSLRAFFSKTRDLTRILARLHNKLRTPRELGSIRDTLEQLPSIKEILAQVDSQEISFLADKIHLFEDLLSNLNSALNADLPNDLNEAGYIRAGFDSVLDNLRSALGNNKAWLDEFEQTEQQRTGIKNLKVKYNSLFGFFIEVTKSNLSLVPCRYIRKQTMTNVERYFTEELKEKETEILHSEAKSIEREKTLFFALVESVLQETELLQETAKTLAEIDVFAGWAALSRENKYSCPIVDNSKDIIIENGRHCVVEAVMKKNGEINKFVDNDLALNSSSSQIMILTGPNMAGKSTYIRQNALIAIMAHMGCFVPAKRCKIGIMDRIFSRIGASDDLSRGHSTFMVEMLETANILNNATSRSLIILDEIGRGTSTYDGLSIAWSVVEYLHKDELEGPRTLFATHYRELTQLERALPRVVNYYVSVKEWNDEIIFIHKILQGIANRSYGIQVAKLAGLPNEVIERAKSILKKLEDDGKSLQKLVKPDKTLPNEPQLSLF